MKNSLEVIISRLEEAEKRITELEISHLNLSTLRNKMKKKRNMNRA